MKYTDVIAKRTRTWPYGTEIDVRVISVSIALTIVRDEANNEGFLLFGHDGDGARAGETGIITFTKGGPTGGYWKFKAQTSQPANP